MPKTTAGINLRLLKIIKRFPELYNSRHDLANDKAHDMVVWDSISHELNAPVNVLKKKWQKLRSSHRKKCRILKISKSTISLPRDDIFHLMYSMLNAPGGDSPGDRDDISSCSAATYSIISEEDRSARSSSTSTLLSEDISASDEQPDSSELKSTSNTRVLRSQLRATRSGPPETVNNYHESLSRSSTTSGNKEESFFTFKKLQNEPVRAFFDSMAMTVAKFPQHLQAATKTKICSIVVDAELRLSPAPAIR